MCIVAGVGDGHKVFPPGSLIPIEGAPRFETATEALKWVRNDSGDVLHGMRVMIFQAKEILKIDVESKPMVKVTAQPKRQITGPPVE